MIDLFPFFGLTVGVLGLGPDGRAAATALARIEAEVWVWDDSPDRRAAAEADGLTVVDMTTCDWGELLSLVVDCEIPHGSEDAHAVVARARQVDIEIIADTELLARSQRDAAYVGVTGSGDVSLACDVLAHVFSLSGREVEVGGTPDSPVLGLYPLEIGGTYVLAMPPGKLDITHSITFDIAIWLEADESAAAADTAAMRQIFHRQTGTRSAVVSVDDPLSRAVFDDLAGAGEQVVVPISVNGAMPGGVYVSDTMLIDAREGTATPVTDLDEFEAYASGAQKLAAAAAYAAAVSSGIEPRVAMACLHSF